MFKLDLEKAEEPGIKLPTSAGSSKKQASSRKTSTSALLIMPKSLTVWITTNHGKLLKGMGIPDCLTCLLRNLDAAQEAGKVVWYSHLFQNFPQFVVTHTVKDFGIVNKAEVDVFLELSWFFYDPKDVGRQFDLLFLFLF